MSVDNYRHPSGLGSKKEGKIETKGDRDDVRKT